MKFKNFLIVFIIGFVLFTAKTFAEIVNKVNIEGNERISKETIVIFGDITLGKDYKLSDINLLIKKLYDTSFFFKYLGRIRKWSTRY